jgi:hypothetical protein
MIFFFYHKWFVHISIAYTIHISLYFFYYIVQILKKCMQGDVHKSCPISFY